MLEHEHVDVDLRYQLEGVHQVVVVIRAAMGTLGLVVVGSAWLIGHCEGVEKNGQKIRIYGRDKKSGRNFNSKVTCITREKTWRVLCK
jgi:hypothetical protein